MEKSPEIAKILSVVCDADSALAGCWATTAGRLREVGLLQWHLNRYTLKIGTGTTFLQTCGLQT
jgi:hypothetical protein